jgi:hypothetical protein
MSRLSLAQDIDACRVDHSPTPDGMFKILHEKAVSKLILVHILNSRVGGCNYHYKQNILVYNSIRSGRNEVFTVDPMRICMILADMKVPSEVGAEYIRQCAEYGEW